MAKMTAEQLDDYLAMIERDRGPDSSERALADEIRRLRGWIIASPIEPTFGNHDDWFDIYRDWRNYGRKMALGLI